MHSLLRPVVIAIALFAPPAAAQAIDFSETDVLAFVGILYVLGLATNRLADDITTPWDRRIKREVFGESPFPSYHEQLNAAVCACYGWPEDTWRDENEVLTRLLKLNLELTADEKPIG